MYLRPRCSARSASSPPGRRRRGSGRVAAPRARRGAACHALRGRGCRRRACRASRSGRVDRRRRRRRRDARPHWNLVIVVTASIIRPMPAPRRADRLRKRGRTPLRGRARALAEAPAPALAAAVPLAVDLAKQASTGALAALARAARVRVRDGRGWLSSPQPPSLRSRSRPSRSAVTSEASTGASPCTRRMRIRSRAGRGDVRELVAARARRVPFSTQEAHSLYLETLAELGPLGLALLLAAFAVPLAAAVRIGSRARRGAVAYDVGAAVDFHWELAGVTVPGSARRRDRRGARVAARPRRVARRHGAGLRDSRPPQRSSPTRGPRSRRARDALRRAIDGVRPPRASALRFAPFSADRVGCDRRRRVEPRRLACARARPERLEPLAPACEGLER